MKPISVIAVGVAAVLGALVWAAIAYYARMEIAWIALIVGAAIGFAASVTGSKGPVSGVVCAIFLLVSIFAGKMFAVQWDVGDFATNELRASFEESLTEATYEEYMLDAKNFAALPEDADYRQFMIDHAYTEADEVNAVDPNEVKDFTTYQVPRLVKLHEEQPTFEEWKEDQLAQFAEFEAELTQVDTVGLVQSDLSVIDILFALLGVAAAYQLGASGLSETREQTAAEE